jgi:hypothetical protein
MMCGFLSLSFSLKSTLSLSLSLYYNKFLLNEYKYNSMNDDHLGEMRRRRRRRRLKSRMFVSHLRAQAQQQVDAGEVVFLAFDGRAALLLLLLLFALFTAGGGVAANKLDVFFPQADVFADVVFDVSNEMFQLARVVGDDFGDVPRVVQRP